MIYKLTCPRVVYLPRVNVDDRPYRVNLNTYRNAYHAVNAQAKKAYTEAMREQLEGLKIKTPVEISYKVYRPTRTRLDKMNVVSVTSKFLMDAITEFECWEDDSDDHIKTEVIFPTEYDKNNGRVEVTIREI